MRLYSPLLSSKPLCLDFRQDEIGFRIPYFLLENRGLTIRLLSLSLSLSLSSLLFSHLAENVLQLGYCSCSPVGGLLCEPRNGLVLFGRVNLGRGRN